MMTNALLLKILERIAQHPNIRTVEIADQVDCDSDQVEPALKEYIARGDVVVHPVTAPNGRPANAFEFTERFKQTGNFKALFDLEEKLDEQRVDADSLVQTTATSYMTKPERAIAYIQGKPNGRATTVELRTVLELKSHEHPASFLVSALKDNRLDRDGQTWILGSALATGPLPEAPPPPTREVAKQRANSETAADAVAAMVKKPEDVQVPVFRIEPEVMAKQLEDSKALSARRSHERLASMSRHAADQDQQAASAPAPPAGPVPQPTDFRCGHWSDGVVEIERGGESVARLSLAEYQHLVGFLGIPELES